MRPAAGGQPPKPRKVNLKTLSTNNNGSLVFDNVPIGHYFIVFKGNNNFKPFEIKIDVDGKTYSQTVDLTVDIVEIGVASFFMDTIHYDAGIKELEDTLNGDKNLSSNRKIQGDISML